jgi:hypothetical protein
MNDKGDTTENRETWAWGARENETGFARQNEARPVTRLRTQFHKVSRSLSPLDRVARTGAELPRIQVPGFDPFADTQILCVPTSLAQTATAQRDTACSY